VEAHPPDVKLAAVRQDDVAELETGADSGGGKVLAVFFGGQAHDEKGLLRRVSMGLSMKSAAMPQLRTGGRHAAGECLPADLSRAAS